MREDRVMDAMGSGRESLYDREALDGMVGEAGSDLRIMSVLAVEAAGFLRTAGETGLADRAWALFSDAADLHGDIEGRLRERMRG